MKAKPASHFGRIAALYPILLLCCQAADTTNDLGRITSEGSKICIIITTNSSRWLVANMTGVRLSDFGEKLCLTQTQSIALSERHRRLKCLATTISNTPGIQVSWRFDARSFGGEITTGLYFLAAEPQ